MDNTSPGAISSREANGVRLDVIDSATVLESSCCGNHASDQAEEQVPPDSSSMKTLVKDSTSLPDTPSSSKTTIVPTKNRGRLVMPKLTNLSDLTLHSPSSQIIGTPFATTNSTMRFEYPFPETMTSDSGSDPSSSASSDSSTHSASGSTFPSLPASPPRMHSSPPISYAYPVHGDLSISASGSSSTSTSTFTPIYTKFKVHATNPPVPPSLVNKRPKWSLNILGRRSSQGSQGSVSSGGDILETRDSIEDVLGGGQVGMPLTLPKESLEVESGTKT